MTLSLDIDLPAGLIDQPRHVRIGGLSPGKTVLQAQLERPDGSRWRSEAEFVIDEQGELDLGRDAPVAGDWTQADPMALVWAMRRVTPPPAEERGEEVEDLQVKLEVVDARGERITGAFTQHFLAPGVSRREIREAGLSGTLFVPPGEGPHPVVIVLNGSGGGTPEQRAALYAAHGYIGFALAYFKAPERPEHISDTPLEYFEQALKWTALTLAPKHDFIAVAGLSRGGELALLLGAYFPARVSAVIGYVPSAVVHGTLRAGRPRQPRDADAWTWHGKALTNVWRDNPQADWSAFDTPHTQGEPIRQAPAFLTVQRAPAFVAAARIPVEHICGPVLLLSGDDDGYWPSTEYCRQIETDLAAHGHAWPVEHVLNEGAGHFIGFPYVPTTLIAEVHPVAGVMISAGGTAQANARANQRSWTRVLAFLDAAVAAR